MEPKPAQVIGPPAPTRKKFPVSILLYILMFIAGLVFEKFHILKILQSTRYPKITISMPSPTPTPIGNISTPPTTAPVTPWITYTNTMYGFEYKCPPTAFHATSPVDGATYHESCVDQNKTVNISVYPLAYAVPATASAKTKEFTTSTQKIVVDSLDQALVTQILDTFILLKPEATVSAKTP